MSNPHIDPIAARHFNNSAKKLWAPLAELKDGINKLQKRESSNRSRERDHSLAHREVRLDQVPPPVSRPVSENRQDRSTWTRTSPMYAVDAMFLAMVKANPHLRPRVGNPDEMRSNRMIQTLENLKLLSSPHSMKKQ